MKMRYQMWIVAVALVAAIAAVVQRYHAEITAQNHMILYARVLRALDDSHTGMISVGVDGRIISQANDAACDIFGYGPGELAGKELGDILPFSYRSTHAEKVQASIEAASAPGGMAKSAVVRCLANRKDDSPVDVYVRVFVTRTGVVTIVSLSSEISYSSMGVEGIQELPKPIAP